MQILLVLLQIFSQISMVYADHSSQSLQEVRRWGFKKAVQPISFTARSLQETTMPSQIPWPLELRFTSEQFGANIHQYQNWTSPSYFHGGLDIRGDQHQEVFSPISGRIEGNFYAYVDEVSGHSTKYFLSYKESLAPNATPPWGKNYFELVITDREGFSYELHHLDPDLLSPEIITKILNGGTVSQGELVGHLVSWSRPLLGVPFHHLHYNILNPDGIYLNPLALSTPIEDHIAPTIVDVYYPKLPDRCGSSYPRFISSQNQTPLPRTEYLVLEAYEQIFGGREKLAPPLIRADFVGHPPFLWDFTQALLLPDGSSPNITSMYLYYLCDEKGFLQTASRNNHFYMRIPLPKDYAGEVQITVADQVGNTQKKVVFVSQ